MDAEAAPGGDPQAARRAANRRKVREHRQRLRANASPEEAEVQAWIDSVYEWPDDEYSQ